MKTIGNLAYGHSTARLIAQAYEDGAKVLGYGGPDELATAVFNLLVEREILSRT